MAIVCSRSRVRANTNPRGPKFKSGTHRALIAVRTNGQEAIINLAVNGTVVLTWKGKENALSGWGVADQKRIYLGGWDPISFISKRGCGARREGDSRW